MKVHLLDVQGRVIDYEINVETIEIVLEEGEHGFHTLYNRNADVPMHITPITSEEGESRCDGDRRK